MKTSLMKNSSNSRLTLIVLIVLAIAIQYINTAQAYNGAAYKGNLLSDLNITKNEFKEKNIGTYLLDAYVLKIEELIFAENYDEADRLGDEAKLFTIQVFNLNNEIENAKTCEIMGCDKSKKYSDEASFEMSLGNFNAAELLKNDSVKEKDNIYLRKKQDLINLLSDSNPNKENNSSDDSGENKSILLNKSIDESIKESINDSENKTYGDRKKNELIGFAGSIKKNETQKILFFEKEVNLFIKSRTDIEKIKLLSIEYSKIGGKNRLNDGIVDMALNLDLGNYEQVASVQRDLTNTFYLANESVRLINYALAQEYSINSNTTGIESGLKEMNKLSDAKIAFEEERFQDSLDAIKQAISQGEKVKSQSELSARIANGSSGKTWEFLKRHIIAIVLFASLMAGIIFFEYSNIKIRLDKLKIAKLDKKIIQKNNIIIGLQKKYYVENKMSKKLYRSLLLKSQREIVDMKEKIAFMREYKQTNYKTGINNTPRINKADEPGEERAK